jgi:hypothetical protein
MSIVVLPAAVELEEVEDDWVSGAVGKLTAMYLDLDHRLEVIPCPDVSDQLDESYVKTGEPTSAVRKKLQQLVGNGAVVGLRLFGKRNAQRLVFTAVNAGTGVRLWSAEAPGEGFEQPIEELTWRFGEEALGSVAPPSLTDEDVSRCGTRDEELCRGLLHAEEALVNLLGSRFERLVERIPDKPEASLVRYLLRFERFQETKRYGQTLESTDLPAPPEILSDERRQAWSAIADQASGGKPASDQICRLKSSQDGYVRWLVAGYLGLAGWDAICGRDSRICVRLENPADWETCFVDSFGLDDHASAMAYFEEFVEKSQAHPSYALEGVIVSMERDVDLASRWIERGMLRAGERDWRAAHAVARLSMARRDAAEAVSWGRRTAVPAWREGWALVLAGRFALGVQRIGSYLGEYSSSSPYNPAAMGIGGGAIVFRPSVQPIVLLDGESLAPHWLKNAGEHGSLGAASRLVEVIGSGDRSVCRNLDPALEPFAIEVRYYCEQWQELVDLSRERAESGAAERASRFMVADALLHLGRSDEAEKLFATVEGETTFRAVQPAASLLSLERLGRIAEQKGDMAEARERYAELVRVWSETDISVPEVKAARKALERLGEPGSD